MKSWKIRFTSKIKGADEMARRRRKGTGFNDKTALSVFFGIIGLIVLQHIEILIGLVMIISAIAALYFGFQWYADKLEREKALRSGIKGIDVMQGTDFEKYLGGLFEDMGYKVEFTPATGDYGADLILRKGGKCIAVQAKRYKSTVGVSSVQQVYSAKSYYKANDAWVVTNNTFTKNACSLAKNNGVKLVDRGQLINFITKSIREIPSAK
jgi:restriction system protein